MPDLKETVERSLKGLARILHAVQASGGHKYREQLKCTDKELEVLIGESVPKLQLIVVSLVLAEAMLKERKLMVGGDRWGEYEERRNVLLASLKEKTK